MQPGDTIGHYRLISKIGEGGMGVVWKALDTRLEREVAIKLLSQEFAADERRLARFDREAKLLAAINHSNVATVYGIDEHEGSRFIAMELIPGEDLAHRLAREPTGLEESLRIARQIASALEATHQRGVIHRDLKPANIYLTPSGDVKVLDFGIARDAADPGGDDAVEATMPGTILGTVAFMSPEQARGQSIDAATDLWSFGCILYRMLAGRDVFEGATRWDRLAAVLRQEPDWSALPDSTPKAVRDLLAECLVKDPAERLGEARAARRVLDHTLGLTSSSGETAAMAASLAPEPPRASQRPLWLLLVPLALLAGWLFYRNFPPGETSGAGVADGDDGRSIAVLPFETIGDDPDAEAFTAGIHDDILNRVAKIRDLRVISRTSVMEYGSSSKSLAQIAAELNVATVLEGGVQRAGDHVRINLRLIDARTEDPLWTESFTRELSAAEIFSIQSDVAEQVAIALQASLSEDERRRIDQLPTTSLEAYDEYLLGLDYLYRTGQKAENLVPACRHFERAIELDPQFARAYAALSRAARDHYWLGSGPEEANEASYEAAQHALEIDPELSEGHLALGTWYYMQRDYEKALEELRVAEAGLPGNSELIRWTAYIVRRRGGWEEALAALRRARALDPRDSEAATEVAFTLLNLRRYDEAEAVYDDVLSWAPDYDAAQIYGAMTPFLRDGTREAARAAAEKILATAVNWKYSHGWQTLAAARDWDRLEAVVAGVDRVTGQWLDYPGSLLRGMTYELDGNAEMAAREYADAVATIEADLGRRPEEPRLHASLGLAYAGLGRYDEAIEEGERAVELMPVEKDIFVGNWMLHDLAWVYAAAGRVDLAVATLDRVLSVPSVWSIRSVLADPRADAMRDDPAFLALVEKHGANG